MIVAFPEWFFTILMFGALGLTGLGVFILGFLFYRDWQGGDLW